MNRLPALMVAKIAVEHESGCWNWTASRDEKGYGRFWFDHRMRPAHRVVYQHMVGPIPDGLQLDHLCRNTGCVNPSHLEPVTSFENQIRGMNPKYIAHLHGVCVSGRHRLTEDNVYRKPGATKGECRACKRERSRNWKRELRASRKQAS